MIDVVEQVKMLLFISNVRMFSLGVFFFFHPSASPDSAACTVTQKNETSKEKFVDNERTTKIRGK
jgi:hypothetical protein